MQFQRHITHSVHLQQSAPRRRLDHLEALLQDNDCRCLAGSERVMGTGGILAGVQQSLQQEMINCLSFTESRLIPLLADCAVHFDLESLRRSGQKLLRRSNSVLAQIEQLQTRHLYADEFDPRPWEALESGCELLNRQLNHYLYVMETGLLQLDSQLDDNLDHALADRFFTAQDSQNRIRPATVDDQQLRQTGSTQALHAYTQRT